MTRVKICCTSSVAEAALAASAGASALGRLRICLLADMPGGPGVIDDLIKQGYPKITTLSIACPIVLTATIDNRSASPPWLKPELTPLP